MVDEKAVTHRKKTRRELNVECSMDVGTPAVFYCSRCRKPFCEECIGRESGRKTFCIQCVGVEESIEDESRRRLNISFLKKKSILLGIPAAAAVIVIAMNSYILFNDQLETNQAEAFEPDISLQLMGITACRANLETLAAEASSYQQALGRAPTSLEELLTTLDTNVETEDPVSFYPYIIESNDEAHVMASCPSPREHGVADITAIPGKPARVVYSHE